jgi:rRNA maturation endonuclease Nob1
VFNWEERTAHKAEWIRSEEGYIYCSSCKREVRDFGGRHESNFCPSCGADMRRNDNAEQFKE